MIPSSAIAAFKNILDYEMVEMERQLDAAFGATNAEAARNGQSGRALVLLTQDAKNSLKARAHFILGQLLRCLTSYGASLDPDAIEEAVNILKEAIEAQAQIVVRRLSDLPTFKGNASLDPARQKLSAEIAQEGPRLIERLTTELKLAAAASQPKAASKENPTFVFNGAVGIVQTGDGSRATVRQNIDTGQKAEILAALSSVLVMLNRPENRGLENADQLRQLVEDTKSELAKPEPNALKIGSSLRTIAETTKFIGALGPAYNVLKPFLSYFGIHLP